MSDILTGKLQGSATCVGVIMAGGSGTRFWPLSRTNLPKQFLPLAGGKRSLIQATVDRIVPIAGNENTLVVTAAHQKNLVLEQLPDVAVLAEPFARNTAACIGFAAQVVLESVGDIPMVCLPADHVVHGQSQIIALYQKAIELARREEVLVTIGIRPTAPETGYGYIKVSSQESGDAQAVQSFVEKPSREVAEQYISSGNYFWNSGMFVWRPSVILAAIEQHVPTLFARLREIQTEMQQGASLEDISDLYQQIESVSIDVGVMEQAQNVRMLAGDGFMWSDVGSWSSWAETRRTPTEEGVQDAYLEGDGVVVSCREVTVLSRGRFVAAVGLQDVIIVDTDDALLVCGREHAQKVKEVVQHLVDQGREELL